MNYRGLVIRLDCIGDTVFTQEVLKCCPQSIVFDVVVGYNFLKNFYNGNKCIKNIYSVDLDAKLMLHSEINLIKILNLLKKINSINYDIVIVAHYDNRKLLKLLTKCFTHSKLYAWSLNYTKNQTIFKDKRLSTKMFMLYTKLVGMNWIHFDTSSHFSTNLANVFNRALNDLSIKSISLSRQASINVIPQHRDASGVIINLTGKISDFRAFRIDTIDFILTNIVSDYNLAVIIDDMLEECVYKLLITHGAKLVIIKNNDLFSVIQQMSAYKYYIGIDGGLTHCAAAVGMSIISCYSNYMYTLWSPWTNSNISLMASKANMVDSFEIIKAFQKLSKNG